MIIEVISLAIVTLLSTFIFYLYLLGVVVSWIQGKRVREEFALNVPSMFVTMIGSGVMLLIFNSILLVSMILISVEFEYIAVVLYNLSILAIQVAAGYIHYRQYEKMKGPVGRSIIHQFLWPNWKKEYDLEKV